jgi:phosphotransferase system HPr (HPr) family protein
MQTITLKIINEVGLHARPAAEFVKAAAQFKSQILVRNLTRPSAAVDAKSILSVLVLGVEKGHEIELTSEGEDEVQAIQSLRALVESDFAGKF